jgi:hypothetical protein
MVIQQTEAKDTSLGYSTATTLCKTIHQFCQFISKAVSYTQTFTSSGVNSYDCDKTDVHADRQQQRDSLYKC